VTLQEEEEPVDQFMIKMGTVESLMKELSLIMHHLTGFRMQMHPNVHKLPTQILKKITIPQVELEE
jgi:hypothetical protein